ncbi:MAG TPA: F0F1 ATP synthase subunit B [Cyclobacteriaceae bacterium]|jgi:F-type H+-transporting ATPase subunit b
MELITPDLGLVVWMTISFSLVLFILTKFAWKPIVQTLKIREEAISEALKSADLAKEEMSKLKADNEKLLEAARLERDKILKEAIAAGNKLKDEAKEDSQRIGKKMIEDARVTIQNEKKTAMEDVKKQLSQFSMEIAEKILRRELENKKAQQKLVNEYIKDMKVN